MSEISLTLVLQIKTSLIINGMAKVQQNSEKITAFGGIFFVLDKFDRILSSPSADTVLRGIEELATENISYTAEKTGNVYDFNTAEKLNQLLVRGIAAYGCPLWNQGHGQGQELPVQIHCRTCQVD